MTSQIIWCRLGLLRVQCAHAKHLVSVSPLYAASCHAVSPSLNPTQRHTPHPQRRSNLLHRHTMYAYVYPRTWRVCCTRPAARVWLHRLPLLPPPLHQVLLHHPCVQLPQAPPQTPAHAQNGMVGHSMAQHVRACGSRAALGTLSISCIPASLPAAISQGWRCYTQMPGKNYLQAAGRIAGLAASELTLLHLHNLDKAVSETTFQPGDTTLGHSCRHTHLWCWQHHLGASSQCCAVHLVDARHQARHVLGLCKLLALDVALHQRLLYVL